MLPQPTPLPELPLLGVSLVDATAEQTLDWLCNRLEAGQRSRVAFFNSHCCNIAARDVEYARALCSADALLPDGSGVAIAAWMHGLRLRGNLNGTDLVPALCGRLAASGRSVFLLGGRPGVADAAAARLMTMWPGLLVAGCAHGYHSAMEEAAVLALVDARGADVLLVGTGVPRQDVLLARVAGSLSPRLFLGVGALFDFLAGRVRRAPLGLRRVGLEWVWRLAQEPARLGSRYLLGNPKFLARAVWAALAHRRAG